MNFHHPVAPISLSSLVRSLVHHHELIIEMTRRDVIGRYKGSLMGLTWSLVNPILLLVIYTFVFSVVFKSRWDINEQNNTPQFASLLFVGMIIHSLFSETLVRAPTLIIANVNYVKKIVFPLEVLPISAMGASIFHATVSLLVLIGSLLLLRGFVPWTTLFLPLVLLPLVVLSLGFAWALASLGVYLRDVAQPIGLLMTILLFFSPVFYPTSALPESFRPWLILNPITFIIEQSRIVLIYGGLPDAPGLLLYSLISLLVAWAGYAWFQKTRKGFANVL